MQLTVTELTARIASLIRGSFPAISVEGEVTNFRPSNAGHVYFQLGDRGATLPCVIFARDARRQPMPSDGDTVVVHGRLDVYAPHGRYQLVATAIEPLGVGELLARIERDRRRFEAEGLFRRALPLPRFPQSIGVVTSGTGAALRDIIAVLDRRARPARVRVYPTLVQGASAPSAIAAMIDRASRADRCSVIIVGRGGGSLEDLIAFSSEEVVRAIAAAPVPVVSGVGHETDTTLSDFAADVRAATPSVAAEIVSEGYAALADTLPHTHQSLIVSIRERLRQADARLGRLDRDALERAVLSTVDRQAQRLDAAHDRLLRAIHDRLSASRHRLAIAATRVGAASPLAPLERGFALVRDGGDAVTSAAEARRRTAFDLEFHDGIVPVRRSTE